MQNSIFWEINEILNNAKIKKNVTLRYLVINVCWIIWIPGTKLVKGRHQRFWRELGLERDWSCSLVGFACCSCWIGLESRGSCSRLLTQAGDRVAYSSWGYRRITTFYRTKWNNFKHDYLNLRSFAYPKLSRLEKTSFDLLACAGALASGTKPSKIKDYFNLIVVGFLKIDSLY